MNPPGLPPSLPAAAPTRAVVRSPPLVPLPPPDPRLTCDLVASAPDFLKVSPGYTLQRSPQWAQFSPGSSRVSTGALCRVTPLHPAWPPPGLCVSCCDLSLSLFHATTTVTFNTQRWSSWSEAGGRALAKTPGPRPRTFGTCCAVTRPFACVTATTLCRWLRLWFWWIVHHDDFLFPLSSFVVERCPTLRLSCKSFLLLGAPLPHPSARYNTNPLQRLPCCL